MVENKSSINMTDNIWTEESTAILTIVEGTDGSAFEVEMGGVRLEGKVEAEEVW
jgi:hypothetical protein